MADVIKGFNYSKGSGRGRGILGLTNFEPCRRPGELPVDGLDLSMRKSTEQQSLSENKTVESTTSSSEGDHSTQAKNGQTEPESES